MRPERFSVRVYGLLAREGRVLLCRSRFLGREFVNFPGGGVELGESPREALVREFSEETGLAVRPLRALYASEGAHPSSQLPQQIVAVYWRVAAEGPPRMTGNGDDVAGLFWAWPERLPQAEMFPYDREFAARLPELLSRDSSS